ncbi:MAG: MobC family plasmid mobilization relaxosome protein [Eubacteriales bacterium]
MKNKKMSIRISEKDLTNIKKQVDRSGKTFTDYVTDVCLGKKIIRVDGLEDVVRQQKAMGNNLNQLVRLCHEGKISAVNLQETLEEFQKINEQISQILKAKEG